MYFCLYLWNFVNLTSFRRRDGIGLEGLSEKSDKYPDIDEWVLNELKSKPDPFKVDKDKKFISAHLDVIPPDVANLMRPNIRRKLVSQLRQSAAASQQTSSQLGDDTVLMPVGGGGDSMDIAGLATNSFFSLFDRYMPVRHICQ